MQRFTIERGEANLTYHSGLALVGMALNTHTNLVTSVTLEISQHHGIVHADVLKSFIGLLYLGKSDFAAVSSVREDDFFKTATGIWKVPSTETLRQRLDGQEAAFLPVVIDVGSEFLVNVEAKCTALQTGHIPLDADVTQFDNSQTKKERVSMTYKGYDGYAI